MQLEDHPIAEIFPLMNEGELLQLADDIEANGLREPIWLYEGKILDGRNRYRACVLKDIDHRVEHYKGKDPLGFSLSKNLHRRHLTPSQLAIVGVKVAANLQQRNGETVRESVEHAAKVVNVGERSIYAAKEVVETATPDLVKAVESGDVSVSAASEVAKLPKAEQKKAVKEGKVKEKAKEQREKKAKDKPSKENKKTAFPFGANAEPPHVQQSEGLGSEEANEEKTEGSSIKEDATDSRDEKEQNAGDAAESDSPGKAKPLPLPPTKDGWGIPIQEHAVEAFAAVPKFRELLRHLKHVRGELTELAESPGGRLLLKRCQFIRAANKHGGRWVLAELDNAIGVLEDATPAHTDCPYHFNTYQKHGAVDDTGRPCPLCDNKRFTGNLKRYQVPPDLLAAMRTHYSVTEGE